jgi:uncharacterized protein YdiU (UPF0061 family)
MPLRFDNRFVAELPGDGHPDPRTRQVTGAVWSPTAPTPVAAPRLLAVVPALAQAIGFEVSDWSSEDFARVFAGNALYEGMQPYATAYGGHQFGHWAGQLGDGRAIALGEVIGVDGQRHELQLKGAGRTPYSRHADGRAVLRSSLREFVCSEAMHALGVPTTRALCLVATGEDVVRDLFYDGHPKAEPGAIVCRVAPSFLRFGHYELPASRGDSTLLERLIDFTLARDYPHLAGNTEQRRGAWFIEVCERTARLVAHWLRVGFVHGVMNTDNLSILGLTIDYGPYGWLEPYDPEWTPNTTDAQGRRYCFGRQPAIAQWNLERLAGALATVMPDRAPLHEGIARFGQVFGAEHLSMTGAKLGLASATEADLPLMREWFALMGDGELDYLQAFRRLAQAPESDDPVAVIAGASYAPMRFAAIAPRLRSWFEGYQQRLARDDRPAAERQATMDAVNPLYAPRNWLAQQAIDAAERGDTSELELLMDTLRDPYREQPGRERFAALRPDWARERAGCSMLSCSS